MSGFEPIAFIESPFKERFGTPRQPSLVPSSWGKLRLRPELNLQGSFEGLEGFSHIWLIFVFHENANKAVRAKIHPPRMNGAKAGLFATRTPHRPNPIGLSAVCLERIEGDTLILSGVDLLDGTPILDIKPYLPSSDCLRLATSGWTASKPERLITVDFSKAAIEALERTAEANSSQTPQRIQAMIREILELDPRPNFYKGTFQNPNPYTDLYGFRLGDLNIVYRMTESRAEVVDVQAWNELSAASLWRKNPSAALEEINQTSDID